MLSVSSFDTIRLPCSCIVGDRKNVKIEKNLKTFEEEHTHTLEAMLTVNQIDCHICRFFSSVELKSFVCVP